MVLCKCFLIAGFAFAGSFVNAQKIEASQNIANNKSQNVKGKMTTLSTYLFLNGNCKQAMEFYKSVFEGELTMTEVGNSPMKSYFPEAMHKKIVNARLTSSVVDISASDWLRPNQTPVQGNLICLYLSGGTSEELKNFFKRLSDGATITDPLIEKPYGTYGALNDQFGIRWMFHADK
jgi:PhnB protein